MSDTYTKLFSSITASTIWQEPAGTRLTWITMLAMARKDGCVYASIPGLAHQANVTIAEVEVALRCFLSPDPYSRTKDNDGRRVEEIDGGWRLLNHAKFGAMRDEVERAAYKREWDRKNRTGKRHNESDTNPTKSDTSDTNPTDTTNATGATPPALALAPVDQELTLPDGRVVAGKPAQPDCPHSEIVALYHEILPELTRVRDWTGDRQAFLRARWREKAERQTLDWWRRFFGYVRTCPFLMGQGATSDDRQPFFADLEWLIRPKNFRKVIEGKYQRRAA